MGMLAVTGLIVLCVYLTGFIIAGRWTVRADRRDGRAPVLLDAFGVALIWPLAALILGGAWLFAWLFGIEP